MARFASYLLVLVFLLPLAVGAQTKQQYITIGLLLPDHGHYNIIAAAELAIQQANDAGGYGDQEFKLLVRTAEGFWGAGSKESVNLVYEDQVRAIIGSLDGRNGHLAEQVATKSHLSYIETFATEATLSQAFVPWFMRVVPNDNQQALAILHQIRKEGGGKICILSCETYDTRYAVKSLTKMVAREMDVAPVVIKLDTAIIDQTATIGQILQADPDHLIIPYDAAYLKEFLGKLGEAKADLKIYGTLHFSMGAEKRQENWKHYEGQYLLGPLLYSKDGMSVNDSRSAFLYDAVNLVINAIKHVGTSREAITDYISGTSYSKGISGNISFDEMGNRKDAARLYQIKNGVPQLIK